MHPSPIEGDMPAEGDAQPEADMAEEEVTRLKCFCLPEQPGRLAAVLPATPSRRGSARFHLLIQVRSLGPFGRRASGSLNPGPPRARWQQQLPQPAVPQSLRISNS